MKKNIFVNPEENRLRAGWRLAIFFIAAIGFSVLFNKVFIPLVGGIPSNLTWKNVVRGIFVIIMATTIIMILCPRIDKKTVVSLGLKWNALAVKDLIVGFLLSAVMVGIIFFSLMQLGMLTVDKIEWTGESLPAVVGLLLWLFSVGLAVGWSEELIFRGYLLQNIGEGIGLKWAILIMCLFYGAVHMPNPNSTWLSGTLIVLIGFIRIFGWLSTRQLWFSMGMHAGWNYFQGPVFGFHVSGTKSEYLIQQSLSGPDWITGGVFGPEAGIITLPVLVFAFAVMWWWTKDREDTPWKEVRGKK